MKNLPRILRTLVSLFTFTLLCPKLAQASQATVVKVKGRQAIVQFPNDYVPAAGDHIEVGPAEGMSTSNEYFGNGNRANSIGISADLSILSNSSSSGASSSSNTNIDVSASYGWNKEIIELGPTISLAYSSSSGSSTTNVKGGGFIDYDLLPNRPTVNLVAGLGAQAYFGQSSPSSGSSSSLLGVAGGGQVKWFCFSRQTALRGDLLLDYERQANSITTTQTGLVAKIGIETYF